MTLPRPVLNEFDLANIENLKWENLKPEFKKECNKMMEDLKINCKVKEIHGKVLNSQMLLGLTMYFCESLNMDKLPKIESTIGRLI